MTSKLGNVELGGFALRCEMCKKSYKEKNSFYPFCSERCQLLDLGKWANEEYRVAGEPAEQPLEENEHE